MNATSATQSVLRKDAVFIRTTWRNPQELFLRYLSFNPLIWRPDFRNIKSLYLKVTLSLFSVLLCTFPNYTPRHFPRSPFYRGEKRGLKRVRYKASASQLIRGRVGFKTHSLDSSAGSVYSTQQINLIMRSRRERTPGFLKHSPSSSLTLARQPFVSQPLSPYPF